MLKALFLLMAIIGGINLCNAAHIGVYIGESTSKESPAAKKVTFGFQLTNSKIKVFDNELLWGIDTSYWRWDNHYGDDITGGAITPTLTLRKSVLGHDNYLKIGIGITYVDTVKWHNRDLGDNWLFENKFEYGVYFSLQQSISVSINHYSNAGLNKFNDGTNVIYLGYSYNW